MKSMTRKNAAALLARRLSISQDAAEMMIDKHSSAWQTFAAQENIIV